MAIGEEKGRERSECAGEKGVGDWGKGWGAKWTREGREEREGNRACLVGGGMGAGWMNERDMSGVYPGATRAGRECIPD